MQPMTVPKIHHQLLKATALKKCKEYSYLGLSREDNITIKDTKMNRNTINNYIFSCITIKIVLSLPHGSTYK